MLLYYDQIIIPDPLARTPDLISRGVVRWSDLPRDKEEALWAQRIYLPGLKFMRALSPLIKSGVILPLPYNILVPNEPVPGLADTLDRDQMHLLRHAYPNIFRERHSIVNSWQLSQDELKAILNVNTESLAGVEAIGVGFADEGSFEVFYNEFGNDLRDFRRLSTAIFVDQTSRRHGDWTEYLATYCLFERLMNILTETRISSMLGARYFTESQASWRLIDQVVADLPHLVLFLKRTRYHGLAEVRKQMSHFKFPPAAPLPTKSPICSPLRQSASDFVLAKLNLPYLEGITFSDVTSLRNDDAFERSRGALRRLNRFSDDGIQFEPSLGDIAKIIDHEVKPEFARLDTTVRAMRHRYFQSAASLFVSLAIGFATGPIGLITLGIPTLMEIAKGFSDAIDTKKLLREHDLYFLWKLEKGKRP
jgi:hypothetical protein